MVPTHHCIIWIFHYRHALILQRIMERPFIRGPPKKVGEIGPLSSQLLKSPSVPSGLHAETGRAPCNNSRAYQALEIKHWRRIWFHIVYFPKLLAQNSRCVVMPPLEVVEFVSMLVSPTNSEEFPLYPIQMKGNRLSRLCTSQQTVHLVFERQHIVGANLGNKWSSHQYLQTAFEMCPTTSNISKLSGQSEIRSNFGGSSPVLLHTQVDILGRILGLLSHTWAVFLGYHMYIHGIHAHDHACVLFNKLETTYVQNTHKLSTLCFHHDGSCICAPWLAFSSCA